MFQTVGDICSSLLKAQLYLSLKMKKNNVHHIYQFCTYNYNFINPLIGTFLIPQTSVRIYPCITTKGKSQSVILDGDQSGALPVRLSSTVWCVTGFRTWVLLVPYVHK